MLIQDETPSRLLSSHEKLSCCAAAFAKIMLIGLLLIVALFTYNWWGTEEIAIALVLDGIVLAIVIAWLCQKSYAFHENGLVSHRSLSSHFISFDNIESYSLRWVYVARLFRKHCEFVLKIKIFVNIDGCRRKTIKLTFAAMQPGELEFLRILKQAMTKRLECQIEESGVAPWMGAIVLTRSGVEEVLVREYSSEITKSIPYQSITRCYCTTRDRSGIKMLLAGIWRLIEIGTLTILTTSVGIPYRLRTYLTIASDRTFSPDWNLVCDCPNFYPGLEIVKKHVSGHNLPDEFLIPEIQTRDPAGRLPFVGSPRRTR